MTMYNCRKIKKYTDMNIILINMLYYSHISVDRCVK